MQRLLNRRGFTLVETLVGAVLLMFSTLAIMTLVSQSASIKVQVDVSLTAARLRTLMQNTLKSSRSWTEIVNSNANLSCMRKPGTLSVNAADCSGAGGPLIVKAADGTILADPSQPNLGFDLEGKSCSEFDAVNGSRDCVFRFDVTWNAVCPSSGACTNGNASLRADLLFRPLDQNKTRTSAGGILNEKRYSFEFIRDSKMVTREDSCLAVGGTYNPTSNDCALPFGQDCPQGQVVKGIDRSTNRIICRQPFVFSCPNNQFIVRINPDGSPDCRPLTNACQVRTVVNVLTCQQVCDQFGNCSCPVVSTPTVVITQIGVPPGTPPVFSDPTLNGGSLTGGNGGNGSSGGDGCGGQGDGGCAN